MVSLPLAGVEQRFMSLSWNSLGSVSLGDLGHTPWFSGSQVLLPTKLDLNKMC